MNRNRPIKSQPIAESAPAAPKLPAAPKISPAYDLSAAPELSASIDALWTRFFAQIHERAALLEAAAEAYRANTLTGAERSAAQAAAHKLAGILGTFGLAQGTELARELERMYAEKDARDTGPKAEAGANTGERLYSIAAELRKVIETRGIEAQKR